MESRFLVYSRSDWKPCFVLEALEKLARIAPLLWVRFLKVLVQQVLEFVERRIDAGVVLCVDTAASGCVCDEQSIHVLTTFFISRFSQGGWPTDSTGEPIVLLHRQTIRCVSL